MGKTHIEWTEETWNPVRGCSIVSDGCRNCYAMRMAHRSNRPGGAYEGLTRIGSHGPTWTGDVRFVPEMLDYPLRLRKPHRIFVNSMSDLFHEQLEFAHIAAIFGVMALAPQHTFQVLTKRPRRAREFFEWLRTGDVADHKEVRCCGLAIAKQMRERTPKRIADMMIGEVPWPLSNVWMGVSAEDQKSADERIPQLLELPAALRWVSLEPLLGPIDLMTASPDPDYFTRSWLEYNARTKPVPSPFYNRLDWVVVGGESGPNARPMHPDWVRSLRDQCAAAEVPFFFKQWGSWFPREMWEDNPTLVLPDDHDAYIEDARTKVLRSDIGEPVPMHRVGKKAAGHLLDGREYREYPAGKNSLATSSQLSA